MQAPLRRAAVVGAGPVGCLAAIAFAKMGWIVDVFELRSDTTLPSGQTVIQSRSINLSLTLRGIAALEDILGRDTVQKIMATTVPMQGRMIHHLNGNLQSQLYDRHGQCINSTDRVRLNAQLLELMRNYANIRIHLKHKVEAIDFDAGVLVASDIDSGKQVTATFNLCVGTDGSYSAVRRQIMRVVRMDYEQSYLHHEYLELSIPAGIDRDGNPTYLMSPDHLHIWPRHSFMLVAFPNTDKSFTCTLFAPTNIFTQISSWKPQEKLKWFSQYFPDAFAAMGPETLLQNLSRNSSSPLIAIKARPYHYKDRAIILGDAGHAMVPFYGQGLNCGLEDVRVLTALLRQNGVTAAPEDASSTGSSTALGRALQQYSEIRHEDAVAICDMAMENYLELRHSVASPLFHLRKKLDNLLFALTTSTSASLSALAPSAATLSIDSKDILSVLPFSTRSDLWGWLPQYTMVAFRPDMRYSIAKRRAEIQARVLRWLEWIFIAAILTSVIHLGRSLTLAYV